ncbi:MAG: bile acid:sodium symporter family protein [Methylophilaceae bacterium]|jgi:BASS family bile acid:Na+ symporter|nr:bile acid:sodium symporter family protein [Methylophilaceae bacterium]
MIENFFLPLGLAFIMFSLGLSLRVSDFRSALANWRGVAFGMFGQVVLVPLSAVLVGISLQLSETMLLGLMIIAACPGGVSSAFLTHLARGNTALSLVLTVGSSLLALLTLPFVVNAVLGLQGVQAGGVHVSAGDLPLGKLFAGLLLVTTLPIMLGMVLRLKLQLIGERSERVVSRVATGFFVGIVMITFMAHRDTIISGLPEVGSATVLLNVLTMLGGFSIAWAAQLERRDSIAIAMECGLQNAGLGIFVALTLFQQPALAVPSVVYALTMNFGAVVFLYIMRSRRELCRVLS